MTTPLRVLILEDQSSDAELSVLELQRAGFDPEWQRVETESDYLAALNPALDLILADYSLPQFDGLRAMQLLEERGFDIPFILVSGTIGEEVAVEAMKRGAADYLLKDRLTRLGQAVTHALEQKRLREEKQRAVEALKLFRTQIDRSNDAIEVLDPKTGRFLDVNEKGCLDLGYSHEELLALSVFDIDPMLDRSVFTRDVQELRKSGVLLWEGTHRRKDGSTFPVEVNIKYVQLDRDYIVSVVRDITERKRAEDALRRAEENYRNIFENSLNGIFQSTPEGRFVMVNPALARMWGYDSPEDLLASVTDTARQVYVDPDRRARHMRLLKEQGGSVTGFEYQARRKDGTTIWVSENVRSVVDSDGALVYYEGAVEDISERKRAEEALRKSEEKYRSLIDTMNEGLGVQDKNGLITFMNKRGCEMLGYEMEELIGKPVTFVFDEENQKILREQMKRRIEGERQSYEIAWLRKDGARIDTIIAPSPRFDEKGDSVDENFGSLV